VGSDVELKFELGPTDVSRSMGFDRFRVELTFTVGRTLTLTMTVVNEDEKPLFFEEAFHSYYHVTDIHEATVDGLEHTSFIDKTDGFKVKPPRERRYLLRVWWIGFTTIPLRLAQFTMDGEAADRGAERGLEVYGGVHPWKELPT